MKTYVATPADRQRDWYVVDAEGQTLGRLATRIADALRGKRKPEYTPHVDTGDFIVVVNAEKIHVTGNKLEQKTYWRHSGYPGGIKSRTLAEMLERRPEEVIRKAVKGMLPRNRLARQQLTKLKVYAGPDHPHAAQQPKPMEIEKMTDDENKETSEDAPAPEETPAEEPQDETSRGGSAPRRTRVLASCGRRAHRRGHPRTRRPAEDVQDELLRRSLRRGGLRSRLTRRPPSRPRRPPRSPRARRKKTSSPAPTSSRSRSRAARRGRSAPRSAPARKPRRRSAPSARQP